MKYKFPLIWIFILSAGITRAQNYNAIHGSDYSGGLGVYNNPSSIIKSPYSWDLTVIGFQFQTISNVIKGPNFPFGLLPNATFYMAEGNFKRYADLTADLHLLNGRIKLSESSAIAFGLNVRQNTQGKTTSVHYTDSVKGPRSFLFLNEQNGKIDLDVAHSAWLELYGSYASTIWDQETSRLNAGISLKLSRGMSGGFATTKNVGIVSEQNNDQTIYKIVNGDVKYGYSANYGEGDSFNTSDLFEKGKMGFAVDLGAEYIIKSQAVTGAFDDENIAGYDWKLGFSLLDLGWNTFAYGSESRHATSLKDNVSSLVLQEKFSSVTGIASFNDSAATIVNDFTPLTGNFRVMNPARAVINIDRYVSGNVFINGELSVNLAPSANNHVLKESKFLTITPRWETKKLGFFTPVQINRHGNFWIGGALKAGPLLIGTHNLLNVFSKNKFLGSGAYMALTIRPFAPHSSNSRNRQYECPTY